MDFKRSTTRVCGTSRTRLDLHVRGTAGGGRPGRTDTAVTLRERHHAVVIVVGRGRRGLRAR